ncbi:hypothetical protein J7M22_17705 [Candidatus Poribacteria bacterium]|nr:hypothetical protein [Candidatus Poribacteria bacterium]
MPLYRWEGDRFRLIADVRIEEKRIEEMIEEDPSILFGTEPIMIIGRQGRVEGGRYDLLGLDRIGNTVIIEVKRSRRPRNTIGQVLEYAARISRMGYADLERIARRWFEGRGRHFSTLIEEHRRFFHHEIGEIDEDDFNRRQRLVILCQGSDPRSFEIVRYLRRLGVDINYISYLTYRKGDETLISAEEIVGGKISEPKGEYIARRKRTRYMTRGEFLACFAMTPMCEVAEEFMRYIDETGGIVRNRMGKLRVTAGGKWWMDLFPSKRGTHFRVYVYTELMMEEVAELRKMLPDMRVFVDRVAFNISSLDQLKIAEDRVIEPARLELIGEG